jgi:predicted aconitase with swiveling domain
MNISGSNKTIEVVRTLVEGDASGRLLVLDEPISFWGGIDPETGIIIDVHHPQCGQGIKDRLLCLSGIRGSTAGPGALLETLYAGNCPKAIVLADVDVATVVALTVYHHLTGEFIPLVEVAESELSLLQTGDKWRLKEGELEALLESDELS